MDDRTEFNRLYWHSRRGMLEIDVMLMPFTQNHYPGFSSQRSGRPTGDSWIVKIRTFGSGCVDLNYLTIKLWLTLCLKSPPSQR
jgi:hypothetical protein